MKTVKEVRKECNLTRDELVAKSGLSSALIQKVEANPTCNVNVASAELLAQALGVEVRDIFHPSQLSERGRPPRTGCETKKRRQALLHTCESCHMSTNASLESCTNCGAELEAQAA